MAGTIEMTTMILLAIGWYVSGVIGLGLCTWTLNKQIQVRDAIWILLYAMGGLLAVFFELAYVAGRKGWGENWGKKKLF